MARQRYPFPFNNIPTFEDASQFEDNVKTDANFEEEMSDEELEDGTAELREEKHAYYGRFLDHLLTRSGVSTQKIREIKRKWDNSGFWAYREHDFPKAGEVNSLMQYVRGIPPFTKFDPHQSNNGFDMSNNLKLHRALEEYAPLDPVDPEILEDGYTAEKHLKKTMQRYTIPLYSTHPERLDPINDINVDPTNPRWVNKPGPAIPDREGRPASLDQTFNEEILFNEHAKRHLPNEMQHPKTIFGYHGPEHRSLTGKHVFWVPKHEKHATLLVDDNKNKFKHYGEFEHEYAQANLEKRRMKALERSQNPERVNIHRIPLGEKTSEDTHKLFPWHMFHFYGEKSDDIREKNDQSTR